MELRGDRWPVGEPKRPASRPRETQRTRRCCGGGWRVGKAAVMKKKCGGERLNVAES